MSTFLIIEGYARTTTHVTPPSANAGVLDRTIEKQYEAKPLPPKREIPLLDVDIPEHQLDFGSHRSVFINQIEIQGNQALKSRQLQDLMSSYEERKLSMQDIHDLCIQIRAYYVEKGYFLARAYPPVQDIKNGILKIEVMEGSLGKITVSGNKHYSEKFIRSYFTKYLGKPINYDDFLRSLMLVNENTDLFVGAVFQKGADLGTADVILQVNDHCPIHAYFNTNDYGQHFITAQRTGARLDYGNFFTNGDTFSIAEVVGSPIRSLWFTDVRYDFPISRSGWSGEVSYMYTHLRVKHAEFHHFNHLHLKSTAEIAGARVTYAVQRSRRVSTDLYASFEYKQIKDIALGRTTSNDRLRVLGLGTDFGFNDGWHGNNFVNFAYYQGIPDFLGGMSSVSRHSSRKGAGGTFSILNLDYKRMQQFAKDFYFLINFSGQYSFYKLPVPEQFYIGGMDTVRGYPLASALGDSGYYMNWELRIPPICKNARFFGTKRKWKEVLQFVLFLDYGGVQLKSEEYPLHKGYVGMVSTGPGVRIYGPYHFDVSIDLGIPLNDRHKHSDSIWYWKLTWSM